MPEPSPLPLPGRILAAFSPGCTPADLKAVYLWVVLAVAGIYVPVLNESAFRVAVALPIILFFPGYALIAALFPGNRDIDALERTALSFGLSIAVAPLVGLVLNYTPWGIRLDPVVISLVAFTACMAIIAQYRRALLPEGARFTVPFREWVEAAGTALFPPGGSRVERLLSAVLVVAIAAAAVTTVYVVAAPREGEKFTEFYILGPGGKAAGYPTDLVTGRPASIVIGIGNHEYRDVTYEVEMDLASQEAGAASNSSRIVAMERIDSYTVRSRTMPPPLRPARSPRTQPGSTS
jgi:uncharacterized membrane protein